MSRRPGRNWLNLWKPTIDALDPLLGRNAQGDWHPRDGRITQLGLHQKIDPARGHEIVLTLSASGCL